MKSNEVDPRSYERNFMQLRKEAWKKKIQDFKGVWTRDLAIPVRCSNQLSYEATDVGSRSIVGSYVPVKEMSVNDVYEINHMWTADMKSNEVDPRSYERNFMQLRKEAWKKIQDFNGVWTRDLAIPVRCSNQLSYEATDVGSRSIVGSYVPVKEMSVNDVYEINHMWTADMKSNEVDPRSYERNFMQLHKEAWKKNPGLQRGLNPWPRDTGAML